MWAWQRHRQYGGEEAERMIQRATGQGWPPRTRFVCTLFQWYESVWHKPLNHLRTYSAPRKYLPQTYLGREANLPIGSPKTRATLARLLPTSAAYLAGMRNSEIDISGLTSSVRWTVFCRTRSGASSLEILGGQNRLCAHRSLCGPVAGASMG